MQITADNSLGAKVGDAVEVWVEPRQVLKGSIVIFLIPLFMMILGYVIGQKISSGHGEGAGILGSVIGLVIAFLLIKWYYALKKPVSNPAKIVAYAQK